MEEARSPVKTELALTAFSGQFYSCHEKGHRASQCPNREVSKVASGGMGKNCNEKCYHSGRKEHNKVNCWDLPDNA